MIRSQKEADSMDDKEKKEQEKQNGWDYSTPIDFRPNRIDSRLDMLDKKIDDTRRELAMDIKDTREKLLLEIKDVHIELKETETKLLRKMEQIDKKIGNLIGVTIGGLVTLIVSLIILVLEKNVA
jgi:tetrahydromethanopterin S-methyltransferase subunit G